MAWTDEQEQRLRRMHGAGWSLDEMARALAMTKRAVLGKRQRLGLTVPRADAMGAAIRRAERAREREKEQV